MSIIIPIALFVAGMCLSPKVFWEAFAITVFLAAVWFTLALL